MRGETSEATGECELRDLVGMWVFRPSDAVGFAALLTTVLALRSGGDLHFDGAWRPSLGAGSATLIALVVASGSLWVVHGLRGKHRVLLAIPLMAVGSACAVVLSEIASMRSVGTLLPASEAFFVVSGYHLLHLLAAFSLAVEVLRRGGVSRAQALYIHFTTLLWVPIFVAFYWVY